MARIVRRDESCARPGRLHSFCVFRLERLQPRLREALAAIAAAAEGPLLFHCVAGNDRTGVVAALLLALADVLPGAIAAD